MKIYTIGFTQRSAENFFDSPRQTGITRLVDLRLRNSSQLAGFAKHGDLAYFLKELRDANYVHEPVLAPSQELFDAYEKQKGSWEVFECEFLDLMADRKVEDRVSRKLFDGRAVLLCSDAETRPG